jgi:hypothetical protein
MDLWGYLLAMFGAGAIGGVVNALMSDNGFIVPKREAKGEAQIIRPGFLGNTFIGGISAMISWGLYGPFAASFIMGGTPDGNYAAIGLSLSSLVGGLLVGIGGARWLTNEVDKSLLRAAAGEAASGSADPQKAMRIMQARPARALKIASE